MTEHEQRRLVEVLETVEVGSPEGLLEPLPERLPDPFTTADLADRLGRSRHVVQEVAYFLRVSGEVETVGRDRRGFLYRQP